MSGTPGGPATGAAAAVSATGGAGPPAPADTTAEQLAAAVAAAAGAAAPLRALAPAERAPMLRAAAAALDAAAGELVPVAQRETRLPAGRLGGELARTTFQLRLFAAVLDAGEYLEAVIDRADPGWGMGPRPDVRRMLVPLGPVVVFAAGNFPFAFSVAGGDTAAALAAGCPVVVKAHPGHPLLSARTAATVQAALAGAGAPAGTLGIVYGVAAGRSAVLDPRIRAGAFTGSLAGGRALADLAASRPDPIPFYAEMGSLNPVFVTPAAVAARGRQIAADYVGSYTLGVGQFCTKPGLLFLPAGHGLSPELAAATAAVPAAPMLDERIHQRYAGGVGALAGVPGVEVLARGPRGEGLAAGPTLLATTVPTLLAHRDELLTECFGPTSLVVEYADEDELLAAAEAFGGNLTATVQGEPADAAPAAGAAGGAVPALLDRLRERVGRLLWNGWPTGVSVTYAMEHGGPYPATNSLHTSVGTTAIRRFLRPVAYQGFPQQLLPPALRDRNVLGIPRRVDGALTTADVAPSESEAR